MICSSATLPPPAPATAQDFCQEINKFNIFSAVVATLSKYPSSCSDVAVVPGDQSQCETLYLK